MKSSLYIPRISIGAIALWASLAAVSPARAQSVRVQISATDAFMGETLTAQVTVSNMADPLTPIPPETSDFEILPNPGNPTGSARRLSIVGGRRTESIDYTHLFQVTPLRTGRLVLPPFTVHYKGRVYHTQQIPVQVRKDASSSSLFCKIKADRTTAYVGQPVALTLEVWIRQFKDPSIGTLEANAMWSRNLRDMQATSPGVFEKVDWERIQYREATQKDEAGISQSYYVFLIETSIYPTKAGPFDFGNVSVAYRYPKKIGRDRFFFNRWTVTDSRRMRAAAKKPRLHIKPIPTKGRPRDFNGAIGPHAITTSAKPEDVPVGDPITLILAISGKGPLEQLRPPRLDRIEALTRDFEVSGESLAGEFQGTQKVFSQTIRALREDVTEIPAIPLSYFDPDEGRFETVWSDPIPLTVSPAETLPLMTLTGPANGAPILAPLVESSAGMERNYDDPAMLLADQSGALGGAAWVLLIALPTVYVAAWGVRRHVTRYRDNEALRRRSSALARARKALKEADHAASSHTVYSAVITYVADRCNVPAGGLTRADALRLLAAGGAPEDTVRELNDLLQPLEQANYGGVEKQGSVLDDAAAARRLLDELERCRFK